MAYHVAEKSIVEQTYRDFWARAKDWPALMGKLGSAYFAWLDQTLSFKWYVVKGWAQQVGRWMLTVLHNEVPLRERWATLKQTLLYQFLQDNIQSYDHVVLIGTGVNTVGAFIASQHPGKHIIDLGSAESVATKIAKLKGQKAQKHIYFDSLEFKDQMKAEFKNDSSYLVAELPQVQALNVVMNEHGITDANKVLVIVDSTGLVLEGTTLQNYLRDIQMHFDPSSRVLICASRPSPYFEPEKSIAQLVPEFEVKTSIDTTILSAFDKCHVPEYSVGDHILLMGKKSSPIGSNSDKPLEQYLRL